MEVIKRENDRRAKSQIRNQRDMRYKLAEDGVVVAAGIGPDD